jgi:hypothetical protein
MRAGLAVLAVLVGAFGVLLAGCSTLVDDDAGAVSESEIPFDRRDEIPLQRGFLDGQAVQFYRLGAFVPTETTWFPRYDKFPGMPVREMYVWPDASGAPALDGEQRPIIDTLPRQASASDFFELVLVRPAGVGANDIKSRATLLRSGFTLERTGKVVNCPVVGAQATLGGAAGSRYRKLTLWYRNKSVRCLLLDGGPGVPAPKISVTPLGSGRSELQVTAGEVYSLRSSAFTGADQVTAIPVPQNDVFRVGLASPDYTPLLKVWDVTVPSDYLAGQVRSTADLFPVPGFVDPRIAARTPETFCNCPLVSADK